jgi:hypothetical protein
MFSLHGTVMVRGGGGKPGLAFRVNECRTSIEDLPFSELSVLKGATRSQFDHGADTRGGTCF